MASFKRLKRSDVISVPYVANKNWVFEYCPYPKNDQYVVIYKGTNLTGSFSANGDPVTEGQYERLVYSQINHLYYQQYSSSVKSLNTSSLISSMYYDGASSVRATSSYFNYNENPGLVKYFPTGANEGIRVLSVSQDLYGEQILPYAFELSSSVYYVKDDGIGNLYDYKNSNTHIGNIFYSQGIAVITNQDYQLMWPLPPLTKPISVTFEKKDSKIINLLSYSDGRGGQLNTSSIQIAGPDASYFTNNGDGTLTLESDITGSYNITFTIDCTYTGSTCDIYPLTSNIAKMNIRVANRTLAAADIINTCDVIVISAGKLYRLDTSTNISTFLYDTGTSSNDVAMTNTKLWVYTNSKIKEYTITLNPWSISLNRTISTLPLYLDNLAGLTAISDNQLIIGGSSITQLNIC